MLGIRSEGLLPTRLSDGLIAGNLIGAGTTENGRKPLIRFAVSTPEKRAVGRLHPLARSTADPRGMCSTKTTHRRASMSRASMVVVMSGSSPPAHRP